MGVLYVMYEKENTFNIKKWLEILMINHQVKRDYQKGQKVIQSYKITI